MTDLSELKCEACHAGAPKVTESETENLMVNIPEWTVVNVEGIDQLQRSFEFRTFKQAWAFSNKVAELAEDEGHHPSILLEWGRCTVTWWTHKINGLHQNDFICASKTDALKD
ncbi:4a-hydroxytetrahydrobiopterin dehydratase [Enterovibrio norvegicus FF-454]|uniref:Putative pterin-4-alpha-carbinolamine dehydratase n=1 Tax=Enterovibrio norvegicus FF-454 TaxID=1185651 RepID=A0A1E5CBS3_9GAMM|nr:4a-hydroxytetrahydrobiopterin dehydratase [Enterovibrio norvegicus]OEE62905.1 4a-hydroxytetrahydrobiopterin dehydratase [Enterovibrio norvegicus FF-454]